MANIVLDGRRTPQRTLAKELRLIVAAAGEDTLSLYAPRGLLTRDELELVELPADPLMLASLLPEKEVAIADRWEIPPGALARILAIDEVSASDVACELMKETLKSTSPPSSRSTFGISRSTGWLFR
jgi:hypothetical protein